MCGLNNIIEGVLGEKPAHAFKVKSQDILNFSLFDETESVLQMCAVVGKGYLSTVFSYHKRKTAGTCDTLYSPDSISHSVCISAHGVIHNSN